MADNLSIDRRRARCSSWDFQTLIVDNYAAVRRRCSIGRRADRRGAHGRDAGDLCGRRLPPGYPEVSDRNATFNGLKASGVLAAGAENAKIHPAVAPLAGKSSSPSIG